jgi:hypothetical protein
MTSESTALTREREARQSAYSAAVAERNALPADAEPHTVRKAEGRVAMALQAIKHWGERVLETDSNSAAPHGCLTPVANPGVAETVDAVAARILASDTAVGIGRPNAEVDAIAMRIIASDGEAKRIEKGDGPKDAEDLVRKKHDGVEDVARRILNS